MALTNAEKQAAHRQRQAERGLVRLQEWVTPDQARTVLAYLAKVGPTPAARNVEPAPAEPGELARLRAELTAAHQRTDYALALAEDFTDAKLRKRRVDADVLAHRVAFALQLRAEWEAAQPKA